jgi:AraC-like DNA-binding protein
MNRIIRDEATLAPPAASRPATLSHPAPSPVLRPVVEDTTGLPPQDQFAAWRAMRAPVLEALPGAAAAQGFAAITQAWRLVGFVLEHTRRDACGYRRTPAQIRRDSLDHWLVAVCREGSLRQRSGGTETIMLPGAPFVFSMADPFESEREGPRLDWLCLYLPRDAVPEIEGALSMAANGRLHGPMAQVLADLLEGLVDRLPEVGAAEAPHIAAAMESLLRGACPEGVDAGSRALVAAGQLARLRRLIRENLGLATLGPERLCRLAGMSRSQLYRLFEPLGGVACSILRERLRWAFRRLADPTEQRSIASIAEAVGMFDPSTFSRAFRQEFGCPPGEVRAAARAGLGVSLPDLTGPGEGTTALLRTL